MADGQGTPDAKARESLITDCLITDCLVNLPFGKRILAHLLIRVPAVVRMKRRGRLLLAGLPGPKDRPGIFPKVGKR